MVEAMVDPLLVVLVGPTASGKTALSLRLAEQFGGEIVSCDSVSVYRGMDVGSAKPSLEEQAAAPHHLIDVFDPDEACTAGDYSRLAREAIAGIVARGKLPIVSGGTGLYLRALTEGLFDGPQRDEELRERLRTTAAKHGSAWLHRILARLDVKASEGIHANDTPKLIRAIEVCLAAKQPMTEAWAEQGRDPLRGYRILRIGLNPERPLLYERINRRAAAMFERGLVEETAALVEKFGVEARPLTSLGYVQVLALLRGEMSHEEAIQAAQQGHRNYAKRQLTWFRRDEDVHWMAGFGDSPEVMETVLGLVEKQIFPG